MSINLVSKTDHSFTVKTCVAFLCAKTPTRRLHNNCIINATNIITASILKIMVVNKLRERFNT